MDPATASPAQLDGKLVPCIRYCRLVDAKAVPELRRPAVLRARSPLTAHRVRSAQRARRCSAQRVAQAVVVQHSQASSLSTSLFRSVADGRCCGRWPMLSPEA
eukprot:7384700-Prymnesium_polylepis.1